MLSTRRWFCLVLIGLMLLGSMGSIQADQQRGGKARISLQFRNANIHDVLKTLAAQGGINIVTSKGVQGTVTVFVDSITVMDAIELVVEMQGLAYYQEHGVVKVVTQEEYQNRFGRPFKDRMQTRVIPLRYASAEEVVKSLFPLKSRGGNLIAEQRSNSVIVVDLPAVLRDMERVIRTLDIPLETATFALDHVAVQNIEEIVKTMVSPGAKVKIDPESNLLVVMDVPERVQRVAEFVREADQPSEAVLEIFTLQYADAEAVAARLQDELSPGVGYAVADPKTNKIFVKDLPDHLPYIRQLVEVLDQRTQEVLIEAKIIQIALNDEHKLGVNWNVITEELEGTIDAGTNFRVLSDGDTGGRIKALGLMSGSYTINGLIEALQTVGKTELLSNPRITCVDGEEAHILVGSTVPYKTIDTRESQGVISTFEKVVTVEVGVKLNVTPMINEDGFITMKIRPEVSNVTGFVDNVPVIEKSESETTVIVKDGVTIIIGGLIKDQKIKTENRIPILGSIPILGFPFRSKSITNTKTELVILLRPQIITGDVDFSGDESG
ncbi:MAG: hypothetical protein D6681_21820 [Calditrichaeota bacterium]|nr:MAG: hypothetical protein D6681_21820 [Calditrichota bacterium]